MNRVHLGEIISTHKGYAFKSKWYSKTGIPIVKVSNLTEYSVDTSDLTHIPAEVAKDYENYILRNGDIIIQTVGSWPSNPASVVGKVIRVPSNASGAMLNQNAVRIDPNERVDKQYLYHLLKNNNFKDYIIGCAQGAASQASITLEAIRGFEFELPPLPTQRKISAILSAYDDLIENNTRRIQILEEMAQAIYREWFIHFRFPGHEDVKMVDSGTELCEIPERWEVRKLSELVKTQYGYTESAKDEPVGPKFVRGKDINKTTFIIWDEVPYCPIGEDDYQKYRLEPGDVLIIRMADPGKVGIIEKTIESVFASYLIRLKIISKKMSPYFLFYTLLGEHYQGYITGASTGTTRKSASAPVITDYNLALPPDNIRNKFEKTIYSIRKMMNVLLEKNSNLRTTRDLLLPRLVSGEVDVNGVEIPR